MSNDEKHTADSLLDWHLDQLDAPERESIEAACRDDRELHVARDRLGSVLRPLDHWTTTPPASNLTERVLLHVARRADESEPILHLPPEPAARPSWSVGSARDVLAVAACIALLVFVLVPGLSKLRSNSRRTMCSNNLSSIFRGASAYQASFGGALPFAGAVPGASWLPTDGRDSPFASNSRHLYLLVKLDYDPKPEDFICPACPSDEPMLPSEIGMRNDFSKACNVSYASLNLAGTIPNLTPSRPIAYLSDANPLFVNARFNPSVDADRTNSRAHGGKGQMVLTLDGSARWMKTPIYGPQRDNLWLVGNIRRYTGVEAPTSQDDVQLVPGYPSTDPEVARRRETH